MQLFEGTAYFATFQTGADPTNLCAFGQSRIWGVDYIQGESPTPNVRNDSVVYEDVLAGYFPAARQSDAAGGFQHYVGPYQDRLILGVGITQRPTCVVGDEVPDPYLGTRFRVSEVGGGQFELIAQASGGSASEGAIDTITQTLPSPASFSTIVAYAGQVDY